MNKLIITLIILTSVIVAALYLLNQTDFVNMDTCLDRGGRWLRDMGTCGYLPETEKQRKHDCAERNMVWDDQTNLCRRK